MPKKSLYIFLTALLGALLFLIIQRSLVFIFLYLVLSGLVTTGMNYNQFLSWDYFTLIIALMLGTWYGIWLGIYWYQKVYEEGSHGGFVHHLATGYFPKKNSQTLPIEISAAKRRLEADLWELEALATASTEQNLQPVPMPIKQKIVRKRAVVKKPSKKL